MMELLRLYINVTGCNEVISDDVTVRMILFDGHCESDYFNGTILPGGVDTQLINADGMGTLSARYMLEGHDADNVPCFLYIENNAVIGEKFTRPVIYTDSKALKWLEKENLVGRIENQDGQLVILIRRQSE